MTPEINMTFLRKPIPSIALCLSAFLQLTAYAADHIPLEVLPANHTITTDSNTGAQLTFLTTKSPSTNFYFHERSWLADGSMVLFNGHRGLMGYLTKTGELVVLADSEDDLKHATAAVQRNSFFCMRGNDVLEITPHIEYSSDPAKKRSIVSVSKRLITTLPSSGQLNGNFDDQFLSIILKGDQPTINTIEVATGRIRQIYQVQPPLSRISHLQWSHTESNLLSFARGNDDWHRKGGPSRLWIVDPQEGSPRQAYEQIKNELCTHESWWVDDQILYCGAPPALKLKNDPDRREMSHVNLLDPHTGEVRIIGAGNWWPDATEADIWRRNWWHSAGSDDGRWVVADNPHGDIVLFEGSTTRPRLLTAGHRIYGGGSHPHPGWDRTGRQVIFASHKLGDQARVCIATIPKKWQEENTTPSQH